MSTKTKIQRADWVIYGALLLATFFAVVIATGDMFAGLIAIMGATLTATHVAIMVERAA